MLTPSLTWDAPIFLTHAGDERLFIVERGGRIRVIANRLAVAAQVFLDIRANVSAAGEGGLLSMAFHPDYASNGYFYVSAPELVGRYLHGDYCDRNLRALDNDGATWSSTLLRSVPASIVSFGEDFAGEAYVVTTSQIYRIVGSSSTASAPALGQRGWMLGVSMLLLGAGALSFARRVNKPVRTEPVGARCVRMPGASVLDQRER